MRRLILAVLLLGYAAMFVRLPSWGGAARAFDPLDPRGREVERAIEAGRFGEALPIARELQTAHAADPTVTFWLAEIFHGLRQPAAEAAAWERLLALTGQADGVCPALPEAYAAAGALTRSLDAYERCAAVAPDDAERWFDLGTAYAERRRDADAARAFDRSRALDPSNPRLPAPMSAAASTATSLAAHGAAAAGTGGAR